jgi:hypothetical protein
MSAANSYDTTIYLLNEIAEFLEGQSDVRDGSYGEQIPNRAMSLLQLIDQEIERLKRLPAATAAGIAPSSATSAVAPMIVPQEQFDAAKARVLCSRIVGALNDEREETPGSRVHGWHRLAAPYRCRQRQQGRDCLPFKEADHRLERLPI